VDERVVNLALFFPGPERVEIREEAAPAPGACQVLIRTWQSVISSGAEMMIYRGYAPADKAADEVIPFIEHFSRILCEKIPGEIATKNIQRLTVRLWENKITWAAFQLER
jgi:hypothetical protein